MTHQNKNELNCPFVNEIEQMIRDAQKDAYGAVNAVIVSTYWHIGKKIVEQEQQGQDRAEYGTALIEKLARELTQQFGNNYSKRNLQYFRRFYLAFPDEQIVNTRVHNLSWSHFRTLLRVTDENARLWYMNEAAENGWSVRTLDRNIGTQYYYRLMQSPKKDAVIAEMQEKNRENQKNQYEMLKSPIVAEFLGFKNEDTYLESDLESAILSHIRDFLMEMGRGFAFVARQQHIVTDL